MRAAAPRVAQFAQDTSCVARLWIAGYHAQLVCAVHADAPGGCLTAPWQIAPAPTSAGTVLLNDRARFRSSCYTHLTSEPMFAAAVMDRGHVVAALGVTDDRALDASGVVVTAAGRLSVDLCCPAYGRAHDAGLH